MPVSQVEGERDRRVRESKRDERERESERDEREITFLTIWYYCVRHHILFWHCVVFRKINDQASEIDRDREKETCKTK
jgi:hypothetical protein